MPPAPRHCGCLGRSQDVPAPRDSDPGITRQFSSPLPRASRSVGGLAEPVHATAVPRSRRRALAGEHDGGAGARARLQPRQVPSGHGPSGTECVDGVGKSRFRCARNGRHDRLDASSVRVRKNRHVSSDREAWVPRWPCAAMCRPALHRAYGLAAYWQAATRTGGVVVDHMREEPSGRGDRLRYEGSSAGSQRAPTQSSAMNRSDAAPVPACPKHQMGDFQAVALCVDRG
jgi:hypothetical protein